MTQQNSDLASLGTDQILDLFNVSAEDAPPVVAKDRPVGQKAILEGLGDLPDEGECEWTPCLLWWCQCSALTLLCSAASAACRPRPRFLLLYGFARVVDSLLICSLSFVRCNMPPPHDAIGHATRDRARRRSGEAFEPHAGAWLRHRW